MSDFNCSYLIFLIIKGENITLIPLDNSHEVYFTIFKLQKYT